MHMQKILVVDDAKPNIKILADLLSDQAQVFFATNGQAALQKAAQEDLDLILLDVMMPGMDGYEVCRNLKSDPKTERVPVVFITGLSDEQDEEKGLKLGAIDYVTKPFSAAIVRARVQNLLKARQYERDLEIAHAALRAAHEKEIGIARDIQLAMLPKGGSGADRFSACEIAAALEPAWSVGGDLYNYFVSSGDTLWFAVGDVSGKGVPAALFMVKTNTLLRSVAGTLDDPGRILAELNRELCRDNDTCMFVTMMVGVVDCISGEFTLASGGHNPPVRRAADGHCEFLDFEGGPVLGYIEAAEFPIWRSQLQPGETLLLYTDGVTEAFDATDHMFSDERLLDVVEKLSGTATNVATGVMRAVHGFAAGCDQSDDITIVALRFDPSLRSAAEQSADREET
jgi:phosphoserine phosphatase RsbU/P